MTFNPWTFLLQMVNFVALAYILHRLLYRPMHEAIERRRQAVRQMQTEAEKAREDADAIKRQLEEKLTQLDRERQETLHRAREQAETERVRILDDAESAARRRQEDAGRALDRDREEMLQTLSGEMVTQAVNLAERLLRESFDSTLHTQLIKHLIEALDSLPEDERDRLRRDWRPDEQTCLEAAAKPDGELLKRLAEIVGKVAGKESSLNVQLKPALIGGARLRIGGHIWDASIVGQLEDAHSRPQEVSTHV